MSRLDLETRARVLRCVPDFGSGETVGPYEVALRLSLSWSATYASTYFSRLRKAGLVERVRAGAYQLARRSA